MSIKLQLPKLTDLRPRINVIGVGGAGCNAINNMISAGLNGVDFVVANTDAQALATSSAEHRLQLGVNLTEGLGAGSKPEIGEAAAEEAINEIRAQIAGSHMVFIAAGMGGGTGTGAAAVIARAAKELGILTVGIVTKPFHFEGARRMRIAEVGIGEIRKHVDTLIVIPNQNLFRVANEKTTFADAFKMADQVLYSGVSCITDLMVKEGLINLDFADVRAVMRGMGKAMMGTGEASGEDRARHAAEAAIANPLLDDVSMHGARGLLISITGGPDLTLYEVDEAASRIREEVDEDFNIILVATFDEKLEGIIRVSVVATGTDATMVQALEPVKASHSRQPLEVRRSAAPAEPLQIEPAFESQVEAAVAEAITNEPRLIQSPLSDDGVVVEPYTPSAHADPFDEPVRRDEPSIPSVYIPSNAARPDGDRRLSRTEELPAVARRPLETAEKQEPEPRNARALFKRLASNVGAALGSRGDHHRDESRYSAADDAAARSAIEAGTPRGPAPVPHIDGAQGQLDLHGRPQPQPAHEKHVEIPSFLRKHG